MTPQIISYGDTGMDELQSLCSEALIAVRNFIAVLESEGAVGYADRFCQVAAALERCDSRAAIRLEKAISVAGMGGLDDLFPVNETQFDAAWGAAGKAIAKIYQYHRSRE